MKHIPPFSKEMADLPVVHNEEDGCRSGFLQHEKITKCDRPEPRKGLADFQRQDPGLAPNSSYPDFKAKDDPGIPETPKPFSKTKISGGPKKPYTPA